MKLNILGTEYEAVELSKEEDSYLKECDGYCDKTVNKIVVIKCPETNQLGDFPEYQKKVLRHEIIHAFLYESGLSENWEHKEYGHDETYVDWIAAQFPKLLEVFKQANCI